MSKVVLVLLFRRFFGLVSLDLLPLKFPDEFFIGLFADDMLDIELLISRDSLSFLSLILDSKFSLPIVTSKSFLISTSNSSGIPSAPASFACEKYCIKKSAKSFKIFHLDHEGVKILSRKCACSIFKPALKLRKSVSYYFKGTAIALFLSNICAGEGASRKEGGGRHRRHEFP